MGDWERHVGHYAPLLRRLIAAFIAWFGSDEDGIAATLSRRTVRLIMRVLVPAESAVRRLIVLAAHEGLAAWKGSGPWQERRRRAVAGAAAGFPPPCGGNECSAQRTNRQRFVDWSDERPEP